MNEDHWYFAYGSNLDVDQKEKRTGRIRQAVPCHLTEHRIVFNKRSSRWNVAANIVPDALEEVWGVAYLCSEQTMETMDDYESGYQRVGVEVLTAQGDRMEALTYVAAPEEICPEGAPRPEYLAKIIKGARDHRLPEEYIRKVERAAEGTERR